MWIVIQSQNLFQNFPLATLLPRTLSVGLQTNLFKYVLSDMYSYICIITVISEQ